MKISIAILFLLCASVLPALAQQTQTPDSQHKQAEQPKTEIGNSANVKPAPRRTPILSFDQPDRMFQILDGKWSYQRLDCSNPITIEVPADHKTIKLTYPKTDKAEEREYIFVVSEVGKYYIRGQYEGEDRKTEDGKLEVWDFMFRSNDEFVWHRADWKGLGATPPVIRCKEEKLTALLK